MLIFVVVVGLQVVIALMYAQKFVTMQTKTETKTKAVN